ncbi:MAG: transhydrogenase alpha subunit [Thermoleophilia bacterium]|nr:transhydrogenase alpha subunit [Thermoleophilia bacterium]
MALHIGVLRETRPGEHRVALTPDVVGKLVKAGHDVAIQAGAGLGAGWADDAFQQAGASVGVDLGATMVGRNVLVKVNPPNDLELSHLAADAVVIAMLDPLNDQAGIQAIADKGVTAFAMELIPRISRAQSMDVLSSMATVAGYRAVLIAAERLDKFFPMLMTAAGTVAPAKVFIIGAGVAGLQAIATARRLGAVVSGYDTRAVVREQVESLGASFLDISVGADAEAAGGYARELTDAEQRTQRELMADHVAGCDVVITTALVPGRPAPVIIPTTTVERMRPGSVIVDLASQNGGNCEVSEHGRDIVHAGVHVLGPDNLPGGMPVHASQLYARNVQNLLDLLVEDGDLSLDRDDEVIIGTLATRGGRIVSPMLRDRWQLDTEVAST